MQLQFDLFTIRPKLHSHAEVTKITRHTAFQHGAIR